MRGFARTLLALSLAAPSLLGAQQPVPTPESALGFSPGADYKLFTYDQAIGYFKTLASSNARVKLVEAGRTSQGRVMYFALISAPENLAQIDRYRSIALRLAHPADMSEDEARRLAREGRAIVHLDGGLHSTEVAGGQQTPLLAYDLLRRADEPEVKAILDNVIVMLWPTINPDGQQMVAEWYMSNVGTPYELSPLPRLYQEYVGHDNNRDAYMLNMIESRVVEHAWRQWEPNVVYTQHQSGPFPTRIWLPPFSEPVGLEAPALAAREVNMMGMAIAKRLEENGLRGATHMGSAFDAWYPGYVDYAPIFKNVPAFWTETALYQYATPHTYTLNDFPADMRDLRPRSLYPSPWPPGPWRLRDAVDYMETASFAVLDYAAKYKESLLLNRYRAGVAQIARGATHAPFAYLFGADQRDPVAVVELLRRLAFGGIRVAQLTAPATIDGRSWPAGTWVIPTDQEFAALARELLDVQAYPDLRQYPGGPPEHPYDAAGWTLPLQMGVSMTEAASPLSPEVRASLAWLGAPVDPVAPATAYNLVDAADAAPFDSVPGIGFDADAAAAAIVPPRGAITGEGTVLALDPAQNNAFRALNRAWAKQATVRFAGGRYLIGGLSDADQQEIVDTLALRATRVDPAEGGFARARPVKPPRIGLVEPWTPSIGAGWTRWLLEQYGFPVVALRPEDFHARLAARVDVVILADGVRLPTAGGVGALAPPRGPVRPQYAYALAEEDLEGFVRFVEDGGTLIAINGASSMAIEILGLPVRDAVAALGSDAFFLRGSLVRVSADTAHPAMAGMPSDAAVFVDDSPAFEIGDRFRGHVLARYQSTGSPLLSGYLIGERYLHDRAAALDVEVGRGHAVLLGFRPEWRGQPFGSFRVLFNAVLNAR
ncbi:MAG: hypothetical protein IT176_13470 [Acidobacteria bacterium]|nr:hypothetical protein [Acidobacteriota bacterium]